MEAVIPNTTIRRYSLVLEAGEREEAAVKAWRAAGAAYNENRNSFTEAALERATRDLEKARREYRSVTKQAFPSQKTH